MLNVAGRGEGRCALMLGGFDGLHRGHALLLEGAKGTGLPVALTTILGGKAGGELFTAGERRTVFSRSGVDVVLEYPFTPAFQERTWEQFLRDIAEQLSVAEVFCGEDFRFGRGAVGTPKDVERAWHVPVHALPLARYEGEKIAATHVKQLLANADMVGANSLLVHDYFLRGRVEHGRHVGGPVLGFPTCNVSVPSPKLLPADGVYAGRVETAKGSYAAIVNIGCAPTFGVSCRKIEAWLDGFEGELYGEEIDVYPTQFLRPVMKFGNVEQLRLQLEEDRERMRRSCGYISGCSR